MARYFTLTEAERLLPAVESAIREAIRLKSAYQQADSELTGFLHRLAQLGGVVMNRDTALALRKRREEAAALLRAAIETIQEYGCEVKDLDIGLIDFRSLYRDEEVYLCWKLGESGIGWWHGLEEGFRGRRPIDDDFLRNHRGEPAR